jgi:large subunit ribosomal protein L16
MLQPKKYKFLKKQKGRIKGRFENRSNNLKFGVFGIQALEAGKLTARQIEAIRRTITNLTKREAKI